LSKRATKTNASELLYRMEGITVAVATPLKNGDGELDGSALDRLVRRLIANGAACLFPLGWCGEQPLLPDRTREAVIRRTCKAAAGKVPVMVGVSEQSLPRALYWAGVAKRAGADLILATPPYSYPIPQAWVLDYFKALTEKSGMPLVVYQNDEVGVTVEADTIDKLREVPGIIGVKAYMSYLKLQSAFYRSDRPGRFAVMGADEYLFAVGLFLGIRHFTMGGPGNLNLRWCNRIYEYARQNNWEAVRTGQKRLMDFCNALYSAADSAYPAVKYALHRLGACRDAMTVPLRPLSAAQKKAADAAMEKFRDVLDPPAGENELEKIAMKGMRP
jgi:dihydrodipicolinate synthase/N-acetylneuraminate lyase